MFNGLFQPSHLILILVVVLIIFGPGKLPEVGKAVGNAARDMRNAFSGEEDEEKSRKKNDGMDGAAAATTTAATTAAATNSSNTVN